MKLLAAGDESESWKIFEIAVKQSFSQEISRLNGEMEKVRVESENMFGDRIMQLKAEHEAEIGDLSSTFHPNKGSQPLPDPQFFLNIVQKAFDPPPLRFEHHVANFF